MLPALTHNAHIFDRKEIIYYFELFINYVIVHFT